MKNKKAPLIPEVEVAIQTTLEEQMIARTRKYSRQELNELQYKSKDVFRYVDELPDTMFERDITMEAPMTTTRAILALIRKILSHDLDFQNLNSERDAAKEAAKVMQTEYEALVMLLETVQEEDASIVIDMLQMLRHPFLNVLRDQMRSLDLLDFRLQDLHERTILKIKQRRYLLKRKMMKIRPLRIDGSLIEQHNTYYNLP